MINQDTIDLLRELLDNVSQVGRRDRSLQLIAEAELRVEEAAERYLPAILDDLQRLRDALETAEWGTEELCPACGALHDVRPHARSCIVGCALCRPECTKEDE